MPSQTLIFFNCLLKMKKKTWRGSLGTVHQDGFLVWRGARRVILRKCTQSFLKLLDTYTKGQSYYLNPGSNGSQQIGDQLGGGQILQMDNKPPDATLVGEPVKSIWAIISLLVYFIPTQLLYFPDPKPPTSETCGSCLYSSFKLKLVHLSFCYTLLPFIFGVCEPCQWFSSNWPSAARISENSPRLFLSTLLQVALESFHAQFIYFCFFFNFHFLFLFFTVNIFFSFF